MLAHARPNVKTGCWVREGERERRRRRRKERGKRVGVDTRKWKGNGEQKCQIFPNLWCRACRGDAIASLLVSAEHMLPKDDIKHDGLKNIAVGRKEWRELRITWLAKDLWSSIVSAFSLSRAKLNTFLLERAVIFFFWIVLVKKK